MQGSLPAGWLAFTGRELNPLDRDEGFQITSSSLPGLFLAQRPKTCTLSDSCSAAERHLIDHLVGSVDELLRYREAERLGGL
jgi:hypothetical protein